MTMLVGRQAPEIQAPAVLPDGTFIENYSFPRGKYVVVVFYPLDFTFVCPSELIALDHRVAELKKRNVEVVSVSIDSHFTHNAWKNTPVDHGGIGHVQYTMVADLTHSIAQNFGVEHPEKGVAFRATFLMDKSGVVRHMVVNDLPLGRNMDEIIRMVDALTYFEEHGEVCPAGWKKGDKGMKASVAGVAEYLKSHSEKL